MAINKKYFWLKLKANFFTQKEIKKLRKIAGGDTYTIIYLKLQLLSIKTEGKLIYEGIEDGFAEELALELDEDVENVKITLMFLEKHGLLVEINEDEFLLPETLECIGKETASTIRSRKSRANKKLLQCNTNATICNTEKELEKEKEKELEKDNNYNNSFSETFKYLERCGFRLTPIQIEQLQEDIKYFSEEWVKDAAKEASNRGKINYSYLKGILDNWSSDGRGNKNGSTRKDNESSKKKSRFTKDFNEV